MSTPQVNITNSIIILDGDHDSLQIHHNDVSLITDNALNMEDADIDFEDVVYVTTPALNDLYATILPVQTEETVIS